MPGDLLPGGLSPCLSNHEFGGTWDGMAPGEDGTLSEKAEHQKKISPRRVKVETKEEKIEKNDKKNGKRAKEMQIE
jgi:hypothetical protein